MVICKDLARNINHELKGSDLYILPYMGDGGVAYINSPSLFQKSQIKGVVKVRRMRKGK